MSARSSRFGFKGRGRALGPSDNEKLRQAAIHEQAPIDDELIYEQMVVFDSDVPKFTRRPENNDFGGAEGDLVFTILGRNKVAASLNGLDARFRKYYPDNPEMVRMLVEEIVTPVGFLVQDPETGEREPLTTFASGGTYSAGAPGSYNIKGFEKSFISLGVDVVAFVPNLVEPVQFGTRASGVPRDKLTLQLRAADKSAVATRMMTILGAVTHDPQRYAAALDEYKTVATARTNAAMAIIESYQVAGLMMVEQLLKAGVLKAGDINELKPANGAAPLKSHDITVRIAEGLGVTPARAFKQSLPADRRKAWAELAFDVKQAMLYAPDPQSGERNLRHEFAAEFVDNQFTSDARSKTTLSKVARTPKGVLLQKQMSSVERAFAAYTEFGHHQRRMTVGRANSAPSLAGTSQFQLQLMFGGGLANH